MGLLESIDAFTPPGAAGTHTVTRRPVAPMVSGKYVAGTASTFTVTGPIQPATDMQRVVGGKDMLSGIENRHVDDVRSLYCATELFVQSPTHEADMIAFAGANWTVFRCEPWNFSGEEFWLAILTRETGGAS